MADEDMFRSATGILKLIALGAHTVRHAFCGTLQVHI